MAASTASYVVLGLGPGADRAAVDRAYRALMKLYHPDRGGDPAKAVEINRAYAEITRPSAVTREPEPDPTDLAFALYARRVALNAARAREAKRRSRWPLMAVPLLLLAAAAWMEREPLRDVAWQMRWRYFPPLIEAVDGAEDSGVTGDVSVGQRTPIELESVRAALFNARNILSRGGLGEAANLSRICYQHFARAPTVRGYDRCVAFDDSVLLLSGANAVDRGVFSAGSLTARQLGAGRILGADYGSIEDRLDRVRIRTMQEIQAVDAPLQPATGTG